MKELTLGRLLCICAGVDIWRNARTGWWLTKVGERLFVGEGQNVCIVTADVGGGCDGGFE